MMPFNGKGHPHSLTHIVDSPRIGKLTGNPYKQMTIVGERRFSMIWVGNIGVFMLFLIRSHFNFLSRLIVYLYFDFDTGF